MVLDVLNHIVECGDMPFMGLKTEQKQSLELEVVSREARLNLTRLVRAACHSRENRIALINMNRFINTANTLVGAPIYRLESDDWGEYEPAEFAWHYGELELMLRRPSTVELAEILADFIQNEMLDLDEVNEILEQDACSFQFRERGGDILVEVERLADISDEKLSGEHPNIRKLAERMDLAIKNQDPAGALHSAASIFETLAKDVLADGNIENQALGGFFEKYRKSSQLPDAILDYVLSIYKSRNTTPLAGHGGTMPPSITMEQAVTVAEMAKAIVRTERQLVLLETTAKTGSKSAKSP